MINYFDTSAFATSVFRDLGYESIDRWIEATHADLAYSDWLSGEFSVAVSRRVRATGLDDAAGYALIASADVYLSTWIKSVSRARTSKPRRNGCATSVWR